jgi:P4 family phage/plasmid primase-like protien
MNNISITEKTDRTDNGVGDESTISRILSLNHISIIEYIDVEKLNMIIQNYNEEMGLIKKTNNYEKNNFKQSLTLLKKYKWKFSTGNYHTVNYIPCKSSPLGRLFSESISLQGLPKKIRHTISNQYYYDIDIKNCHPVILVWYCQNKGIKCDSIKHYINNRDDVLKNVSENFDVSIDIAKKNILSIMNGGNGSDLIEYKFEPEWFYEYCDEIKNIHMLISNLNPDFKKEVIKSKGKNYYNIDGCVVNKVLCYYENLILNSMITFCKNNKVSIGALCFDGLMISKNLFQKNVLNLKSFIKEMVLYIKQKNNIDIDIVEKPMNDIIDLSKFKIENDSNPAELDLDSENECPTTHEDISIYIIKQIEKDGNIYYSNKKKCVYIYNDSNKLFEEKPIDVIMNFISSYMSPLINNKIDYLIDKINEKQNEKLSLDNDLDSKRIKKIDNDIKYLTNKQKPFFELLNDIKSTPFQKNVLTQIKNRIKDDDEYIESTFNKIKHLLAIADNKVINLQTLDVVDRTKEHCFTYTTNNTFKKDRPNKEWVYNYISQILKTVNEKFIQCFLTWFGYCMTGETCVKSFPILSGDGDNGKSAFFNVIKKILGKFGIVGNEKVFLLQKSNSVHSDEYLPLIGKRFAYIQEISKNSMFNEKLIKSITGGDGDISVRGCGGTTMEVILDCKLLCICNGDDIPDFVDKQGFTNRVMVFPFKNKFERDPNKLLEIESMKDDIFTELCYYVKEYFYDNNMIIDFSNEINDATNELKENKDSIKQFLDEKIEISPNDKDRIKKDTVYKMYLSYCRINNFDNIKVGKLEFYKTLINKYNFEIYRDREFKFIKFIKDDDFDDLTFSGDGVPL